jgi:predicted nucleotidyltransferase
MAIARAQAALRAVAASGTTQREIAAILGVSQSAVSQQLKTSARIGSLHPGKALQASADVLKAVAAEHGFTKLAVFGSVARGEASDKSDIDLLVQPPKGASVKDIARLKATFERILAREIDLITYGGLKPVIDDDILREAVLL